MDASSVAIVTKFLDSEQQKEICLNLSKQIISEENIEKPNHSIISTFCDLIEFTPDLKPGLEDDLSQFSIKLLEHSEEQYDSILKLSEKFEKIPTTLIDFISTKSIHFLNANPRAFQPDITAFLIEDIHIKDEDSQITEEEIAKLFKFTEWFFMSREQFSSTFENSLLDKVCFLFLGYDSKILSQLSLKVLRWRMDFVTQSKQSIELLWTIVFKLMDSGVDSHLSSGFTLWLRFFNKFGINELSQSIYFQNLLKSEKYWLYLRDGLISIVHEHKKFSLTLTQMSVRSLSTDLSLPIMRWDTSKREEYLEGWKRFCTLYEILGIDTAMNQAEAAANDMIKILSPSSCIPVPFALTILSVAFKASMDSVRKFAMNLVFCLPRESLGLFKYDFKFLTTVFLPFTLNAFHFNISKSMDNSYRCEFGQKLTDFVSNCIAGLDKEDNISTFVELTLEVLVDHKLAFDPARFYVSNGILAGLEKKHLHILGPRHINLLYSLYESKAEGHILETATQTIYLRIFLRVDAAKVGLLSFFESVSYFIQHNGYQVYSENEEFFIEYLNLHYGKEEVAQFFQANSTRLELEAFTIILSNLVQNKFSISLLAPSVLSYPQVEKLLINLANSSLEFNDLLLDPLIVSRIERLIKDMVQGSRSLPISVYAESSTLISNDDLFNDDFWMSFDISELVTIVIDSLNTSTSEVELRYSISQFKFISNTIPKIVFNETFDLTIDRLVKLLQTAFQKLPKGGDYTFYKAKDSLYSLVLSSIEQLLKVNSMDKKLKITILEMSESVLSKSEYHSHLANVNLLSKLVEVDSINFTSRDATSIVSVLDQLWQELIVDRLILSQKDLHQSFIRLVLNRTILKLSIEDEELSEKLFEIIDDIISKSYSRKALLPVLFKTLSDYQVYDNESFEKTIWLGKVLVRGNFLLQSVHNLFKLDIIIGSIYDKSLNMSGIPLYKQAYGDSEIKYRVHINVITSSIKSSKFALGIWNYILNNENTFHVLKAVKRNDTQEQWRRMQLLMLMTLTMKVLEKYDFVQFINRVMVAKLLKEQSPLCRMYVEWMISYCVLANPESKDEIFKQFGKGIQTQQPLTITAFERISVLIAHQLTEKNKSDFIKKFATDVLIPTATSNRALNRHFSVSLICYLQSQIEKNSLVLSDELTDTLANIYKIAADADGFGKYRSGDAVLWNITNDFTLVGINGGVLLKISDREIDAIREKEWKQFITPEQEQLLNIQIGKDEESLWIQKERSPEVKLETFYADEADGSSLLQTKSGAWSTVMEVDDSSRAAASIKRSPLIVVGSLVDKAPNLGGICRLCDVLGAGWLTLHDLSVKDTIEFKVVAVTADRWMPMLEVKMEDIVEFMKMKKKEGYTLIGLEQTDKSVELNGDLKFPEKSLILLGKEKEGIPGDLLAELDMCVIIKQVGVVRSMNIQTATAVIVHAYSSQHC